MSLTFIGPVSSFERRWIVYAILRDNVQHHLEDGSPTEAFAAIHAAGDALGQGPDGVSVNARKLRDELLIVKERLLQLSIAQLAISIRTRAVTSLAYPLPEHRETGLVQALEWTIPYPLDGAKTLGDIFGTLVNELLTAIGDPDPSASVRIVDV